MQREMARVLLATFGDRLVVDAAVATCSPAQLRGRVIVKAKEFSKLAEQKIKAVGGCCMLSA